jgi:hypothetical protein
MIIWKLIIVFIHKVLLEDSHFTNLNITHGAFILHGQSWVEVAVTLSSMKLKAFPNWLLEKNFAEPCSKRSNDLS